MLSFVQNLVGTHYSCPTRRVIVEVIFKMMEQNSMNVLGPRRSVWEGLNPPHRVCEAGLKCLVRFIWI